MPVYYRMTVYATSSVSGGVLTPRAGAAHSNPFQVTTQPGGVPGSWFPYMNVPQGGNGRIDPLSRHTDLSEWTVTLLDPKVLSANDIRWVTAFWGDTYGNHALKGCLAVIEESIDGGGSWTDFFKGRIETSSAPDPRTSGPLVTFTIKDFRVEEYRNIFSGPPHASVSYARPSPLLPIGRPRFLADTWTWMNSGEYQPALRSFVTNLGTQYGNSTARLVSFDLYQFDNYVIERLKLTQGLAESLDVRDDSGKWSKAAGGRIVCPDIRLRVQFCDGWIGRYAQNNVGGFWLTHQAIGEYYVTPVLTGSSFLGLDPSGTAYGTGYDGRPSSPLRLHNKTDQRPYRVQNVGVCEMQATHPNYLPLSYMTVGQKMMAYLYRAGVPSEKYPIMINPVHPAQLWMDICDGKFGDLDVDGNVARTLIPYDSTQMALMLADTSIPKVRFLIDRVWDLQEFMEESIFKPFHLAARAARTGKVFPVDMRLPNTTTLATVPVWDTDDIISAEWKEGEDMLTQLRIEVVAHAFEDEVILELQSNEGIPDVPGCGLLSRKRGIAYLSNRALVLPLNEQTIKAYGLDISYNSGYVALPGSFEKAVEYMTKPIADEYMSRFGSGAAYLDVHTRRTAATLGVYEGDWVNMQCPSSPNSATTQRGGTRYMQCIERQADLKTGDLIWRFIDGGPASVTASPGIGALSLVTGSELHKFTFGVTPTQLGADTVQVQYAITAQSVGTRPVATSPLWTFLLESTIVATVVSPDLPAGSRVWVRGRTIRNSAMPSDWVFPSNNFIDLTTLPSIAGLAVGSITNTTADVTWTVGSTVFDIEIYLSTGASVTIDAGHLLARFTSTTPHFLLTRLDPNAQHTVGVRYVDQFGGVGTLSTATFTTLNTALVVAPKPAGLTIY